MGGITDFLGSPAGAVLGDLGSSAIEGAFSWASAGRSMKWQEQMANTAHQREVADLIKAGLNPILSAGGSGAPVGSSATASMRVPALGQSYQSAASAEASRRQIDAQTKLLEVQADKTASEKAAIDQNLISDTALKGLQLEASDLANQYKAWEIQNAPSAASSARASEASQRALNAQQIAGIQQAMKENAADRELQDMGAELLRKLRDSEFSTLSLPDIASGGVLLLRKLLPFLVPKAAPKGRLFRGQSPQTRPGLFPNHHE